MLPGDPVANVSCGVPVTVTGSVNVTVTGTCWSTVYAPLARVEDTPVTVGAVVSTTRFRLLASEPFAPGAASVSVALLVTASLIDPLLSVSAVVAA